MRFAAVLLLLVPVLAGKWRATPHGMRPEECILEVPSGSRISEVNGQVRVEAPNAEVTYYPAPAICHTDAANRGRVMHHAHETIPVHGSDQGPPAFPPINGWLDYGGWYPGKPDNNIQFMGATYTVPATPAANNQQVLFYFIGIQDNSSPNAVNILQPVLTFGNGLPGWYVESWACCPTNISVHSSPVTGLKTGTTMTGFVQRQNADVWEINSSYNGKNTSLFPDIGGYNYNWFACTEEVYSVSACNQFPHGPMSISKMVLKDNNGDTLTPSWTFTGSTQCGGSIKQVNNSPLAVNIVHSQSEPAPDAN